MNIKLENSIRNAELIKALSESVEELSFVVCYDNDSLEKAGNMQILIDEICNLSKTMCDDLLDLACTERIFDVYDKAKETRKSGQR